MAKSRYEYVKNFEQENHLLPDCHIVVRVDGRGFHKFSKFYNFEKPNDLRAIELMNKCAELIVSEFDDVIMAYGDSDEYSFLLRRKCSLFERRESKLVSTFASTFTSYYVALWGRYFSTEAREAGLEKLSLEEKGSEKSSKGRSSCDSKEESETRDSMVSRGSSPEDTRDSQSSSRDLSIHMLPTFDARCVVYPTTQSIRDYFAWRQVDCHINNLYNTTFWTLVQQGNMTTQEAEQRLSKTLSKDKHELLFSEFGLNYNNEPDVFKKGTTIVKEFDTTGLSQRQVERKMKKMGRVRVMHCDIIRDAWWNERKWILE
ncbi:tRNA(His) guanylyltransferase [Yarrowia sp. C11]|nr:tRNA(His) guanylyltransferase [Yarrowia sp. E02]KAG5371756.1 tRNA(His) guanylyltransferase [Yarrowia sp. C11]